jgi:NTE family protein
MRRYTSFILLLFFVNVVFSQEAKYENLVFEGSGIRGIAYCGVLSELEKTILLRI